MKSLSILEVEEMIENEKFSPEMKNGLGNLLLAINDWSSPVVTLSDYDVAVQNFINGLVTKRSVEIALNKIDLSSFAWEAESLSSLLKVFAHYREGITLSEIINDIR